MTATLCVDCSATWTGYRACHCASCHRSFVGVDAFDRHRRAEGEHGRCASPLDVGLVVGAGGRWRIPDPRDEQPAVAA